MSLRSILDNARESLAAILVSLHDASDNSKYAPLRYISPAQKQAFVLTKRRILARIIGNTFFNFFILWKK